MNDAVRPGAIESTILASNERDLVGDFLNRYRDSSFRIAMRIVGDRDAAEDIAQEALIRAFRSWDRLAAVEHQAAWVRRVVIRCALNAIERSPKHADVLETVPSANSTDQSALVQAVLDTLSAEHRVILGLSIGESLSYREIAETLQIPMGTVASRVNAAKAAFRKAWEGVR